MLVWLRCCSIDFVILKDVRRVPLAGTELVHSARPLIPFPLLAQAGVRSLSR